MKISKSYRLNEFTIEQLNKLQSRFNAETETELIENIIEETYNNYFIDDSTESLKEPFTIKIQTKQNKTNFGDFDYFYNFSEIELGLKDLKKLNVDFNKITQKVIARNDIMPSDGLVYLYFSYEKIKEYNLEKLFLHSLSYTYNLDFVIDDNFPKFKKIIWNEKEKVFEQELNKNAVLELISNAVNQ